MKPKLPQTDAIALIAALAVAGIIALLALHLAVPSYLSLIAITGTGALAGVALPTSANTTTDVEDLAQRVADKITGWLTPATTTPTFPPPAVVTTTTAPAVTPPAPAVTATAPATVTVAGTYPAPPTLGTPTTPDPDTTTGPAGPTNVSPAATTTTVNAPSTPGT